MQFMRKLMFFLFSFLLFLNYSCSNDKSEIDFENGTNISPNRKNTGSSANDFLSSTNYKSLVIEVNYVENFRPNAQTLLNLREFLENRINKPNGITIIENKISPLAKNLYNLNDIVLIENANRTKYNTTGTLAVYLLYINGNAEEDTDSSKTLGTAYFNTSAVLFEKTIQDLSDEINEPNRISLETTVLLHEFGHLLGLVDLGSNMQNNHLDSSHDKHCDNESCLMYWQVENMGILQMMSSGNIPQLDTNCLLDLQANGGK